MSVWNLFGEMPVCCCFNFFVAVRFDSKGLLTCCLMNCFDPLIGIHYMRMLLNSVLGDANSGYLCTYDPVYRDESILSS